MNRPKTQTPRRPRMASAKVASSAKDAAISLVRLEFAAARVQHGLDQAISRARTYQHELDRNRQERRHLMAVLAEAQRAQDTGMAR